MFPWLLPAVDHSGLFCQICKRHKIGIIGKTIQLFGVRSHLSQQLKDKIWQAASAILQYLGEKSKINFRLNCAFVLCLLNK